MNKATKVNDMFMIYVSDDVHEHALENMLTLYQPIIGYISTQVYLTLWKGRLGEAVQSYHQLLALTHIPFEELSRAFTRLEAVQLIRTYEATNNDITYDVYEVRSPLSVSGFLKEQMFVQVLENYTSDAYVLTLKEAEKANNQRIMDLGKLQNVSNQFKTVFKDELIRKKVEIVKTEELSSHVEALPSGASFFFDTFYLLLPTIVRDSVNFSDDFIQLIHRLATLHSLTSEQMAEAFNLAYQKSQGVLSEKMLRDAAYQTSIKVLRQEKRAEFQSQDVEQTDPQLASIKDERVRKSLYQMKQKSAKSYVELLTGSCTPRDEQMIQSLNFDYGLPEEVINVLFDYAFKTSEPHGLYWKFIESIAQQWSKEKIVTAEEAYLAVAAFAKQRKERAEVAKNNGGFRGAKRTEIVTDFDAKADKLDENMEAEFERLMRELEEGN